MRPRIARERIAHGFAALRHIVAPARLDLDQRRHLTIDQREQIVEPGKLVFGIEEGQLRQLFGRISRRRTADPGQPVEFPVVHQDCRMVLAALDIAFDTHSPLHRSGKGGERVLRHARIVQPPMGVGARLQRGYPRGPIR